MECVKTLARLISTYNPRVYEKIAADARSLSDVDVVKSLLDEGADIRALVRNGNNCLHLAVRSGNIELAAMCLQQVNVNRKNEEGCSPLAIAVWRGHRDIAALLLENEACVDLADFDNLTPLYIAIVRGNLDLVELLLDYGANPFFHRFREDQLPYYNVAPGYTINLFLAHGVDVNRKSAEGSSALHLAVEQRSLGLFHKCMEAGLDVNEVRRADGRTPLHLACVCNAPIGMIGMLVERGADANLLDKANKLPLAYAVTKCELDGIKYLVRRGGARANGCDECRPIFGAIESGKCRLVKYLLKWGARVDARNGEGKSPWQVAVELFHRDSDCAMLELLCANGANVNEAVHGKYTAIELALRVRNVRLFDLAAGHGATIDACTDGQRSFLMAVENEWYEPAKKLLHMGLRVRDRRNAAGESVLLNAIFNTQKLDRTLCYGSARCSRANTLQLFKLLVLDVAVRFRADDDVGKKTFLAALRIKHATLLEHLLVMGADVSLVERDANRSLQNLCELWYPSAAERQMHDIFLRHIAFRSARNLHVHKRHAKHAKTCRKSSANYRSYREELSRMKKTAVCGGHKVTYFNVAAGDEKALDRYLCIEGVRDALKAATYATMFRHYCKYVEHNYSAGMKRLELRNNASYVLGEALHDEALPPEIVGEIIKYLDADDMRALISAFKR